jgi:predicted N-acetyltransferase YhbS
MTRRRRRMTEISIEPFTGDHLDGLIALVTIARDSRGAGLGSRLLRHGLERAGGVQLDVRTRTEGYYERLGANRSLGFRLTREVLGLDGADAK